MCNILLVSYKNVNALLDACLENPCKNGGTCVDSGAGRRCLCLPTYGGDFCETGELPACLITLLHCKKMPYVWAMCYVLCLT